MFFRAASLLITASLLPFGLTGCGYHVAGSATHIPVGVKTLAVPVFTTKVQAYGTETRVTEAMIRELNTRTRYRVTTNDSAADATLTGVVTGQSIAPLTYDSTTGQTSSYLITVTLSLTLKARDGRVLYQNNALTAREQYQSTQDLTGFLPEDVAAVRRLSQELARSAVSDMLESF